MSKMMLDVGQANEVKLALRREGWSNEELKMACERKGFLGLVRETLLGRAEIKQVEYLVDLDADPFIPEGWKLEEHQKGGKDEYNSVKVELYLSKKQKSGMIGGHDLRKELKGQPVMNANLLDFYLKNLHLIPESWKGKVVFFWGTIYRDAGGYLYVRYLYWAGGSWVWYYRWLFDDWNDSNPALVSGK